MALRGAKPTSVSKRLKLFIYGGPGVGKTFTTLTFPRPYLVDCEKGAVNPQYTAALEKAGGAYFGTSDFDEILAEVQSLLSESHDYRTLVIDPFTVPYADLLDRWARKLATPTSDGTEFGRHKARADREVKRLLALLLRLDMNVIVTSHVKTKWTQHGSQAVEAGTTFDAYSKLDYLFDLVLEMERRGKERVAIVRKSRLEAFPEGDAFPATYAEIAKRYGSTVIEKPAESSTLVSSDDAARIRQLAKRLMKAGRVEKEAIEGVLSRAGASKIEDLSAEHAAKLEAWLESKRAAGESEAPAEA